MSIGPEDHKISLRQYLLFRALESMMDEDSGKAVGMAEYMVAVEAVSSTALAHPDWDMDARQEWAHWERWAREQHV